MGIGSWDNKYLGEFYDNDRLALLSHCLMWVFFYERDRHRYIKGLLGPPGQGGLSGGDPGFSMGLVKEQSDADYPDLWKACLQQSKNPNEGCYEFFADSYVSGIEPDTAYYPVEEVRYYIKLALHNLAKQHPEKKSEVDELLERYHLLKDTWKPESS
jgi:hypothetical protein